MARDKKSPPDTFEAGAQHFDTQTREGVRFATIRWDADASAVERGALDDRTRAFVEQAFASTHPDRFRLLWKAVIWEAARQLAWKPPEAKGGEASVSPPTDVLVRRCIRVLAMVHELHKAGYQRIRVLPMLAPSGCYWRAIITPSDNIGPNGYHILDDDMDDARQIVARYTSGQDNEYFGWTDAGALDARAMANLFLQRFPRIAAAGEGLDWSYAGWLTDVLGHAERHGANGGLIYLIQDGPTEPDYLRRWGPPPPFTGLAGKA